MKKAVVSAIFALGFSLLSAQSAMDKIVAMYNLKTNGAFELNATKSGDGYDLTFTSAEPVYKEIFNSKLMHVSYDDGPIVTSPEFTLASAGLSAEGSIFDFFTPDFAQNLKKGIKGDVKYSYEGIVSFGGELKEEFTVEPIKDAGDAELKISASKLEIKSKTDLETLKGETKVELESLTIKDKVKNGELSLKDIEGENIITEAPVDGVVLFGKTALHIKELGLKGQSGAKKIDAKFALDIGSEIRKVDEKLLDAAIAIDYKALDAKSIVLAQGIEKSKLHLGFQNFGITGVVELIKLSQKLEKINAKLSSANQSGNDIEIQKAIIESTELTNSLVPTINHLLLKDKSRLIVDWTMKSKKENFIKLNLLYKGEPLSGNNIQSAMISLMAQQLTLVDGTFDIAMERDLIMQLNPLSLLFLDMAKSKGFVSVKDSVYRVKGELKGGKIIINGKSYTIEELTKALF
jgi:hypothetical protein